LIYADNQRTSDIMPERVTREEKIIELAILKAREVKALRDGLTKDEMPTVEKIKRPKAKVSKHGIKQNQIHANAGGESFTSGKIKKMTDNDIRRKIKYSQDLVNRLDAQIAAKEEEFKGKEMTPEQKTTLKLMKARVEAIYGALTLMVSKKYKRDDEKEAMANDATDRTEDPRDVEFTEEEARNADVVLEKLNSVVKEIASKLLSATTKQLGKYEADLKEAVSDLKEITKYYGRSS
jgi:hypothetical protein